MTSLDKTVVMASNTMATTALAYDKPQPPLPESETSFSSLSSSSLSSHDNSNHGPFSTIKEGEYEVLDDGSGVPSLERVWFTFSIVPSAKSSSTSASTSAPRGYTIRRRFMDFRSYGCLLCTYFGDDPTLLHTISDLADNTICNEPGNNYSLPSIQSDLNRFVNGLLKLPSCVLYARPSMEFFGIWPSDLQASGNCVAFTNAVGEQWINAPRSVNHPSLKSHRRSRSMTEEPVPWMQRASMFLRPRKHRDSVLNASNGVTSRSRRHFQASKIGLPQLVESSAVTTGTITTSTITTTPTTMSAATTMRDESAGTSSTVPGHAKSNSLNVISGRLARALHRSRPSDSFNADAIYDNSKEDISWPIDTTDDFVKVAGVTEEEVFDAAALVSDYSYTGCIPTEHELNTHGNQDGTSSNGSNSTRKDSSDSDRSAQSQTSYSTNGSQSTIDSNSSNNNNNNKGNTGNTNNGSIAHPLGGLKQAAKSQPNLTVKTNDRTLPAMPALKVLNASSSALNEAAATASIDHLSASANNLSLDTTLVDTIDCDSLLAFSELGSDGKRVSGFSDLLDLYGPLKSRDPGMTIEEMLTPLTAVAVPLETAESRESTVTSIEEDVPLKISVVQWRYKKPLNLFVPYDIDYCTLHDVIEFELRKRDYIEKDASDTRIMIWTAPADGTRSKRILGDRTLSKEIDECNGELRLRCEIAYSRPREHRKSRSVPIVGLPPKQARWRQSSMEQVEESRVLKSHYISKPKPKPSTLMENGGGCGVQPQQGRRPSLLATKLETIHSNETLIDANPGNTTESLDDKPPSVDTNQAHEVKTTTKIAMDTTKKMKLKKPAPLQLVTKSKKANAKPKVPHPQKSSARLRHQPMSASKTTPNAVGLSFNGSDNDDDGNDESSNNSNNDGLKVPTSGFEAHRRKRLVAAATAAAAFTTIPAKHTTTTTTTGSNGAKNTSDSGTNTPDASTMNEDENTQAVRFRVKKNANYDTLKSAVFQSLLREQLPAEVLAGRTLVFRCPDGSTIPLTDDKAVAAAFKQCKGKVTLTCV